MMQDQIEAYMTNGQALFEVNLLVWNTLSNWMKCNVLTSLSSAGTPLENI